MRFAQYPVKVGQEKFEGRRNRSRNDAGPAVPVWTIPELRRFVYQTQGIIVALEISPQRSQLPVIIEDQVKRTPISVLTIAVEQALWQPVEKIRADTERDNFMSGEEAVNYGLIDKVLFARGKE